MLKVLLVDDEPFILQGMCAMIDWEAEGFCIAGTVENGRQAVDFLKQEQVSLIIADVRMPEMNGLELLEKIRNEHLSDARFVILSGISDFSYAQQAIRYQCLEYILKPVQKEKLLKLLRGIAGNVNQELQQKEKNAQMEEAYYARSLVALLMGKYDQADLTGIQNKIDPARGYRYIGMEARKSEKSEWTEEQRRGIQRRLYGTCLDFARKDGNCYCIFNVTQQKGCHDVGLICCDRQREGDTGNTDHTFLKQLRTQVTRAMQEQVWFYAGCKVNELSELSESFRTAEIAKSCQAFTVDKDIVWYEEEMKGRSDSVSLQKSELDSLISAVAANDHANIESCVERLYKLISKMNLEPGLIDLDIGYILFQFVHLATQQDDNINQEEVLHYISANAFDRNMVHGSEAHFRRFVLEYAEYLATLRNKSAKGVLADIERDVEEHYQEEISLKTLSVKYYLNSAYLGQLFKKKFGKSFKNFLASLRIEKAAQMLLQTDDKVYEIANRVGYRDIDYFIDRFVKLKGCTPTKFRRKACSKNNDQ